MVLAPGAKLGPYEIQSPLGAGGMGEVYRARDTRLERTVAIKILPEQVSHDSVRKQRFEREAKTISSLNHPHICTLHDIGSQDGVDYLVMECVEGETLAKRLEKGPLPLEQVLKFGAQIADALDKAHRAGIVHRDLKPGNIMLTASGAKLLDFGLAKPAAALASGATLTAAVTKTTPVTQEGTIVGTFQYMSPEQIEGKELDGRSDVFSLGAVLYEMLTGKKAFEGKSQLSVGSAILEKEPAPISIVKPMTPPMLDHAIRRCLAKEPEKRWQSAADLAGELQWAAESVSQTVAVFARSSGLREPLFWFLALGLLVVTAFGLWGWLRAPEAARRPVLRWTDSFPAGYSIMNVTLSPDGSHLAYSGRPAGPASHWQIYVRSTDQREARSVSEDDPINVFQPYFFSWDGKWIAYLSQGKLKKVPVAGGSSITICNVHATFTGAWGPDNTIIVGENLVGGLSRVSVAGGKLEALTTPNLKQGETAHAWPSFLPGGKALLFSIRKAGSWDDARIAALNLRTGEIRVLLEGGSRPQYVPTGHLVYTRGGSLFAVPFDAERLEVKGAPSVVLEGVFAASTFGFTDYSFSDSGDLVYRLRDSAEEKTTMVWVDRTGKTEPIEAPPRTYANPSVSPDGRRVAVGIEGGSADHWDIWVYDLGRLTLTKLTYGAMNFAPMWTPDGKRVTFRNRSEAGQNSIFWAPADGSGPPEQLFATGKPATPGSWVPDGSALVFYQALPGVSIETCVFPVHSGSTGSGCGTQAPIRNVITPQLSHDGRWLAYVSAETGISQVYVQPFPGLVGKWQVSTDGGNSPRWAQNGRELYYRNENKMMAVEVQTINAFRAGVPRVLFEGNYAATPAGLQPAWGYDVAADGKRFLMIRSESQPNVSDRLQVVENWFEELHRRVPSE